MSKPRALIAGGSVGGLLAANLLRSIGWEADVYERATSDLADRGAGIGTRADLFSVLKRIGIDLDPTIGVEVAGRQMIDPSGRLLHEVAQRQVTSAWSRIYTPLKAGLPAQCYHAGISVERVDQRASSVTVHLSDGSSASGDLLIGADGMQSTVRELFLPQLAPRYVGYYCWRGVVPAERIDDAARAVLRNKMTFCLPEGELMLTMPNPGGRWYFGWFRPASAKELEALCTDAGGRCHGSSIPPALIRAEVREQMRSDADVRLAPAMAALARAVERPLLHGVFELESERITFGRVALLGDAAFVARPHVATGVTKAALDAQCLVDALAQGDIDAGLARYESERRAAGADLVARSRVLGSHIEPGVKTAEALVHRRPEILLAEYGSEGRMVDAERIRAALK